MIGVVARSLERARQEAAQRDLGPEGKSWVPITTHNHTRGCRLDRVIWTDGWFLNRSQSEADDLVTAIQPCLVG